MNEPAVSGERDFPWDHYTNHLSEREWKKLEQLEAGMWALGLAVLYAKDEDRDHDRPIRKAMSLIDTERARLLAERHSRRRRRKP